MMTNLFEKQRKPSPFAAIALLSILLGAQVGTFASVDPGGPPPGYSYSYGYSIGWYYQAFGSTTATIAAAIEEGCRGKYGSGSAANACATGGVQGAKDELKG